MQAALDIENHDRLREYLRVTDRIARDESPRFETLAGGVSNRTVLVERASGESWVIKQALEKLRTRADWFSDPSRVHREALGMRWLEKLAPAGTITPLVFEDFEHHLIAMHAVPKPHENWKTMLLAGDVREEHVARFAGILASIHGESARRRGELETQFADTSFFESLRLEPYYVFAGACVPEAAEFLDQLIADTRKQRRALVHGDFSPKNILVHQGRLILLDHEVIHWGDPAFDVGFALTHLLSKAHHRQTDSLATAAVEFCRAYVSAVGPEHWDGQAEQRAVRHTLACLLARVTHLCPTLVSCAREFIAGTLADA